MNKITAIIKPVLEEVGKFGEVAKEQVTLSNEDQNSNDDTKQLVKDIYKPGEEKSPAEIIQNKAKEEAKLAKTRAKLAAHQQYVQSTFNRPKPKEEPKADELERKKNEENWELKEKEKQKPPPLPVQRAQNIEKHRGASG